jgi:hypothetical protein
MVCGLFDKFLTIFQDSFIPFQDLCVDESLVLFKGRPNFKLFIKTKRHRFGIKLYLLCDCETGYVSNFRVYTGKDTNTELNPDMGVSGSVVTTLIALYLNKGHTVYTDNCIVPVSSQTKDQFLWYSTRKQKRYATPVTKASGG